MRRMTGVSVALSLSIGTLAGAACGGGGADDKAGSPLGGAMSPESDSTVRAESATGTAVEEARVTIGESVHYAGFVFELGDAALAPSETAIDVEGNPDPTVGQLTVDAVIENLGESDVAPDQSQLYLEQGGTPLDLDPYSFEGLPVVPGGSTANAEIVFDGLPGDFDLDNAALVFGDGTVNQARVPLDGQGETVLLEPLEIAPGTAGQAGEVSIAVTGGQLIYGDPEFHTQLEEGTALMVLEYEVTASPALYGSQNVGWASLRLVLPDGTSVADTVSASSNDILDPAATLERMITRYEVPADVRGDFQLALRGLFASECCAEQEGMATFELPE